MARAGEWWEGYRGILENQTLRDDPSTTRRIPEQREHEAFITSYSDTSGVPIK